MMDDVHKKLIEIDNKTSEHDIAIAKIANSIEILTKVTEDSSVKLSEIAASMSKQEILLERLANLETMSKDSFSRVHRRIDQVENSIDEYAAKGEGDGCAALRLLSEKHNTVSNKLDRIESAMSWVIKSIVGLVLTAMIGALVIKRGM